MRSEKRTLLGSPRRTEIAGRAHSQETPTAAPGLRRCDPRLAQVGVAIRPSYVSEFVRPAVWPSELVRFIALPPFYSRKKGRREERKGRGKIIG